MFNWDNRRFQFLILGLLALIWGSSFLLMKKGLEGMDYQEVALWRLFSAFCFLVLVSFKYIREFRLRHFFPLLIVAIFGNALPAFLFTKAETVIDSSVAGILNSLVPLFTLIIGLIFFQIRIRWYNVLGIAIGFGGAIILFYKDLDLGSQQLNYAALPALAALSYAISLNTIKYKLQEVSALAITLIAFSFIGPPTGIYMFSHDLFSNLANPDTKIALVYVVILGVFGTAVALMLFNKLVKHSTAIFASSVTYLIPIVALMWGIVAGEDIGPQHFIGLGVILAGVWLVTKKAV
jgi:drug/metabolite transporter (DMT)-like permease